MDSSLDTKSGKRKWLVLFMCFISYCAALGFNTTSLAILLPSWSEAMGWSTTQYALVAGAFPMGTVCTVFLTGTLLDKFKARNLIAFAVILNGVIMICRGFISSFNTAYFVIFLAGVAAAIINPGTLKMVNSWFDRSMVYRCNGIIISSGAVGYFIGFNGTIPWSEALGGWNRLFIVAGIVIILLGLMWFVLVPHRGESEGAMNKDLHVQVEGYTAWRRITEVFSSKQAILMFISEFFIWGAILSFSSVGPKAFLTVWEGLEPTQVALIISMSNIGSGIGYWVLPPIADKFGYRKRFIIPAQVWAMALYTLALFTGNVIASCVLINLAGFANGFGLTGGRTLLMEHPDIAGVKAGTAAGWLIEFNKLGCVVFPLIFAKIFDVAGGSAAWIGMFAVGLIGIIPILFAQDTGRRAEERRKAKGDVDKHKQA